MIRGLSRTLTGMIGMIGTVAVYVVFLLLEQHSFKKKIAALVRDPEREALIGILERIGGGYRPTSG